MKNDLIIKIINDLENIMRQYKNHMSFILRGEEAILIYLYKRNKNDIVIPSEISECLNISTARVAASLNSLQAKNLITREIDIGDRRKINIKLTKKGLDLAEIIKKTHQEKINYLLEKLSEEEKQQLYNIIQKTKRILSEETRDAKIN